MSGKKNSRTHSHIIEKHPHVSPLCYNYYDYCLSYVCRANIFPSMSLFVFILCCTLARGVMWLCQIPHYLSKPDPSLLSHQPPLQSNEHVSVFTHISSATQETLDYNAGRERAWKIFISWICFMLLSEMRKLTLMAGYCPCYDYFLRHLLKTELGSFFTEYLQVTDVIHIHESH